MDKINEVVSMVRFGRFEEARKALVLIASEEVNTACGFLYDLGGYEENICAYGFICYLIFKNESFSLHETALNILEASFSYLDGAYQGAYYHGSKMTEFKSIEGSFILYEFSLYGVPGGGISDEEARETAQKMIEFNPEDQFALRILRKTSRLEGKIYPSVAEKQQALIDKDVKAAIKEFIVTGRFLVARKLLSAMSWDEVYALLLSIGRDDRSLCGYAFMWLLLNEDETAERHALQAEIAWETFKYLEASEYNIKGAEELRLFHIHRAAKVAPDDMEIQEKLLALYVPEGLSFDAQEAQEIAKRVHLQKPESEIAQRVLTGAS